MSRRASEISTSKVDKISARFIPESRTLLEILCKELTTKKEVKFLAERYLTTNNDEMYYGFHVVLGHLQQVIGLINKETVCFVDNHTIEDKFAHFVRMVVIASAMQANTVFSLLKIQDGDEDMVRAQWNIKNKTNLWQESAYIVFHFVFHTVQKVPGAGDANYAKGVLADKIIDYQFLPLLKRLEVTLLPNGIRHDDQKIISGLKCYLVNIDAKKLLRLATSPCVFSLLEHVLKFDSSSEIKLAVNSTRRREGGLNDYPEESLSFQGYITQIMKFYFTI